MQTRQAFRSAALLFTGACLAAALVGSIRCVRPVPTSLTSHPNHQGRGADLSAQDERVLIIAAVTEQLGKAAMHIDDLLELCVRFNRTCVLPGIAGSQFELDGVLGFDDIYDLASIPPSVRITTWTRYIANLRQHRSPRLTMCALGKELILSRELTAFTRSVLFHQKNATFEWDDACSTTAIGRPVDRGRQMSIAENITSVLRRADPIIAMFHMDWSEPLPNHAQLAKLNYSGLEFSHTFYDHATAFRERVGDYVSLQWRTEKNTRMTTNFSDCAVAAIRYVKELAQRTGIHPLYFSADVGRDGVPWSNSYSGTVPDDAVTAINLVHEAFPEVLTWVNVSTPNIQRYDMAVVGVIDRIIAMGSTYFVRGPDNCTRVGGYVGSIEKWRMAHLNAEPGSTIHHKKFGVHVRNKVNVYPL